MDLLNSDWLIHMLEKSSQQPTLRLLNLFTILNDWLEAPSIDKPTISSAPNTHNKLTAFLALEAAKAGLAMPEMLANQLYFMAMAAAQEKILHPNTASLMHAQNAAKALINAQTKPAFYAKKSVKYGVAATGLLGCALTIAWLVNTQQAIPTPVAFHATTPPATPVSTQALSASATLSASASLSASPTQTAALFAKIEQMRKGDCQLIEALQLPDSYKKVYFENIVLGQISTNPADQKLVHELLEKVRCNYTPMLMANSK